MIFINPQSMRGTWQAFERMVCRYLVYRDFEGVRVVGSSGDKGADIIAHKESKRWLFQVKQWARRAGAQEVEKTVKALSFYDAHIPVIVCRSGFDQTARSARHRFYSRGIPCHLWDASFLERKAATIFPDAYPPHSERHHETRKYQEQSVQLLLEHYDSHHHYRAMVVMATGLGKTRIMCEFIRRLSSRHEFSPKVLALAHTNDLVYQLERSFWPYLQAKQQSVVWNGREKPEYDALEQSDIIFACLNTVAQHVQVGGTLPSFDVVLVDECHHVGDEGMYSSILKANNAGCSDGPFLVGVTATPWRPDEYDLKLTFGEPVMEIDMVAGLRSGFLSNVDYRLFTTNLDWSKFSNKKNKGKKISPKGINRTIFISEWDDGVVDTIEKTWCEQINPRAIVFCGTITHAKIMRDKINARNFGRAEAVFSATGGRDTQAIHDRNRIISDFQIGKVQIMCCVDIFNEGMDVPDVNIVVFQRVTHSRRIFVQQLGRGLRLAPGKENVIVLDFVSDIRRFAAGIEIKDALKNNHIQLNHKIDFYHHTEKDSNVESFLREWLKDMNEVADMDENDDALRYPDNTLTSNP